MGARGITCTIGTLPKEVLTQIDNKLRQGIPQKRVAEEYGLSVDSIGRHYRYGHHIISKPAKKRRAPAKKPEQKVSPQDEKLPAKYTGADSVLKSIYHVLHELEDMFNQPENDTRRLEVAKVMRGFHELSAKIEGLIKEGQINILINPQWVAIKAAIIRVLDRHPDIKDEVLEELQGIDGDMRTVGGDYEDADQ